MKKRNALKTPKDRSPKSHVPPPPRELEPKGTARGPGGDRGTGQFTGRGQPALEKK